MQDIRPNAIIPVDPALQREIDLARSNVGRRSLQDDELLILCCAEIMRTYTREEAGYQ